MVASDLVLIAGVGGVGRTVLDRLRAQDVPVRAMVRHDDERAADRWRAEVLVKAGLPPHTEQHIATMARLHRENRYDRATDDVERLTGVPARTIEAFVAARRDFYLG
jgi:uncharacterized protein YbjT (DUF2867 family)